MLSLKLTVEEIEDYDLTIKELKKLSDRMNTTIADSSLSLFIKETLAKRAIAKKELLKEAKDI